MDKKEKRLSAEVDTKYMINFFTKSIKDRKDSELKKVSNFLLSNYTYFIKLKTTKDFDLQKIEKMLKYAKLEQIPENTTIFNYGEPADKFYITLSGSVVLYKPDYKEVLLTPYEFYEILNQIKYVDIDILKYERIIEKNNNFRLNSKDIKNMSMIKNRSFNALNKKIYFLEYMEKIGVFKDGFAFGEMALLNKTTRNATIRTVTRTLFLTVAKKEYNIAMRELHDKILGKDIEKLIKNYPIFEIFNKDMILDIMNNLSNKTIYKEEYLFHKGEEANNIYLIKNGIINISFDFSFAWLNEFLNYFNDNEGNMLIYLINNKPKTFSELQKIIDENRKNLKNKYTFNSPKNIQSYRKWEECNAKINKNNFIGIRTEEDDLNNKEKKFNINLKNISGKEILGLEEAMECKKMFFDAKCVSKSADLYCIKSQNLIKVCRNLKKNSFYKFLEFIIKRKDLMTYHIINKVNFIEKNIIFDLNNKYDMLQGNLKDIKNEEDKNRIVSLIKFKGFKNNINELLDQEINVSNYIKTSQACKSLNLCIINPTQKELTERNQKNINILKLIERESKINKHLFQFKVEKNNIKNIIAKNIRNKKKKKSPFSFDNKTSLITRENTYRELPPPQKNEFNFNKTFLSPNNYNNRTKNLFTKVFPNLNTGRTEKISKKIFSLCSSPLKEKETSSNFTESENDKKIQKNKIHNFSESNNYFNKIFKRKNNFLDLSKKKEENEDNEKNNFEKLYYERLKREQKDFYIGEKFNKKFMSEINKIKPIHYKSFFLKKN